MAHDYTVATVFDGAKRVGYKVLRDGVSIARTKTLKQATVVAIAMIEEDES